MIQTLPFRPLALALLSHPRLPHQGILGRSSLQQKIDHLDALLHDNVLHIFEQHGFLHLMAEQSVVADEIL